MTTQEKVFHETAIVQCDLAYNPDVLDTVKEYAIYLFGELSNNNKITSKLAGYLETNLPKLIVVETPDSVDWEFLANDIIESM